MIFCCQTLVQVYSLSDQIQWEMVVMAVKFLVFLIIGHWVYLILKDVYMWLIDCDLQWLPRMCFYSNTTEKTWYLSCRHSTINSLSSQASLTLIRFSTIRPHVYCNTVHVHISWSWWLHVYIYGQFIGFNTKGKSWTGAPTPSPQKPKKVVSYFSSVIL